jgi:CelD/BcsL family acetyltransferase involved in cellulose biosynthesis
MPVAFPSRMIEVQEIRDIEELAGYRMIWNSWLAETPRASFTNTYDWLANYWQHFGAGQQLRALVVRSAGAPIGILPSCLRTERHGLGTQRVLTYPLDGWGSWYGPIGSNPAATMMAAMQHLRRVRRDWDVINFPACTTSSRDAGRVGRSMRVVGLLSEQRPHHANSIVEFAGDFDAYLGGKSRKVRHELRRLVRRVFETDQLGLENVEFIRHRPAPAREGDGDPRWDLYAMCQQIALASWQADSSTGTTLTHPRVKNFFRDAHALAARAGMVDVNLLLVDGRPAAFAYNYHHQGRLLGVRVGYDASLGISGLGTALLLRSIEDSCERGDVSLDLGPGETAFKRRLRTCVEETQRNTHAPLAAWKWQSGRLARWATQRFASSDAASSKAATA